MILFIVHSVTMEFVKVLKLQRGYFVSLHDTHPGDICRELSSIHTPSTNTKILQVYDTQNVPDSVAVGGV
jgi:hypothetical protein